MSVPSPIKIGVKLDEQMRFRLYAEKLGSVAPAGERLFRGKPYPTISFVHDDEKLAWADAHKLQEYLDAYSPKPKKRRDELAWG